MIAYNPREWFGLIFRFHKSDTFRQMFWVLFFFSIATVGLVYAELHFKQLHIFSNTIQIHSLLGFVIGLLLVFRTNSAYDRWWEGRKQWGALVNNCRNIAIKTNAAVPEGEKESRQLFSDLVPLYVYAMKEHLRNGVKIKALPEQDFVSKSEMARSSHIPNLIASKLYAELHRLYKVKVISGDQLITLDKEFKALTDIIGACERIKNTPIPFSYNLFLKKFIFAYTITLPFGLAHDFHYWTVPISVFVLYIFGSLELLAEEIEDPFGLDTNDLPTDDLADKINDNVREILN
jgi:putative membrane protein